MPRVLPRSLLIGLALAATLVGRATPALADAADAAALVDSVYGERIKQVTASRDPADDLELARELYRIASAGDDGPDVAIALCDRVYQLASRQSEGLDLAVDAMRLSIVNRPAGRAAYLDQAIALQQRAYAGSRANDRTPLGATLTDLLVQAGDARREAGAWADAAVFYRRALAVAGAIKAPGVDAIRRSLNDVQNRPKLEARADQLKDRLKASPDDRAAASALIDLYLVELDSPADARKYTFLLADPEQAARIKLAATPLDELPDPDLIPVGDLYRDLAARANADARPQMVTRSFRAYAEWLDRAAPDAADRFRVEVALGDLKNQLASYGIDARTVHRPSADNRIVLTVKPLATLTGHTGQWATAPEFSPDGKHVAAACDDGAVRIYDAANGRLLNTLAEHKRYINAACYTADGSTILSAGADGQVIGWATATNRPRFRFSVGERRIRAMVVSADGKRAVSAANDGLVQVWLLSAPTSPVTAHKFASDARAVALSPDGRVVAAGGEDRYIVLADASSGTEIGRLNGHWNTVHGLAFSPDGRTLASAASDGTVRLWDVARRITIGVVARHEIAQYRVAFSPDGRLLAVGAADHHVRVYDAWFLTLAADIDAKMEETYGVSFDPLGQRLVIAGKDQSLGVYALNREYHKAAEPITRNLPPTYFWCENRRVRKVDDNGVFWIMSDAEPVGQSFFAHADGNYRLLIKASATQAGDERPKLDVKLNDAKRTPAATFEVKATSTATPDQFTVDLPLTRGMHNLYLHYTNDFHDGDAADRNVAIISVQVTGVVAPAAALDAAPASPDAPPPTAPAPPDSE